MTDKELATEYLRQRYRQIQAPKFTEERYIQANMHHVLKFPRRMILLRAGRGDIENAWSNPADAVIEAWLSK